MATVDAIKEALLSELHKQLTEGTVVMKDGEPMTISPPASLLAVAAKVVNDLAKDGAPSDGLVKKAKEVSDTLAKYREREAAKAASA